VLRNLQRRGLFLKEGPSLTARQQFLLKATIVDTIEPDALILQQLCGIVPSAANEAHASKLSHVAEHASEPRSRLLGR
jgi:hypothetical protein